MTTQSPVAEVREVAGTPTSLRFVAVVPDRSPQEVFELWTVPEKLKLWWPPEATVDLRPGGTYQFSWPKQGWTLRGTYTSLDPGRSLAFSWTWDHEKADTKQVTVRLSEIQDGGTEVQLEHGPYEAVPADEELRQSHREGWTHFLGRLVALPTGPGR